MRFADPLWLLLIVPLAAWVWLKLAREEDRRTAAPYPDLSLLERWTQPFFLEDRALLALKAAGFLFLILALARPQNVSTAKEPPKPVVDIVLCLDTSGSMQALDFEPLNRLEMAKKTAEEFVLKRPMDRIGLVVFGGKAMTQCPLTLDHDTLVEQLRAVPLNATQADGTAIGTALALSASQLAQSEAKTKIIILLTDGRSNQGPMDPVTAAQAAADVGVKVYAIGAAVPGGGMVEVDHPLFGKRRMQMAQDLDEGTLLEVARVGGAKYWRVTSAKQFSQIYSEIDRMEKTKIEVETTSHANDKYAPLLLMGFLLLGAELALASTLWRTAP